MRLVRCRICGEILNRSDAVRSDVRTVPGGETFGYAHRECQAVAASPSHLPEEGDQ